LQTVTWILLATGGWLVFALAAWGLASPMFRAAARADRLRAGSAAHEVAAVRRGAKEEETRPADTAAVGDAAGEQAHGGHVALAESGYMALVVDRLAEHARTLLGVERCWVLLRDRRDPKQMIVVSAKGLNDDVVGRRLPANSGLAGLVAESGRSMVVDDYNGDEGPVPYPGSADLYAAASAPVAWEGAVRGALSVATSDPARALGVQELELLGEVAELAGAALEHYHHRGELAPTADAQVSALSTALAVWDGQTAAHCEEVVRLALLTGEMLGLSASELVELELAARLHDIGKIRVPLQILRKRGPLTAEERRLVELHPAWGAEVVARVPGLQAVAVIVRHHHERVDGSGYPSGLSGERIPAEARIVAACDAYRAMTEDRPFRRAYDQSKALDELKLGSGSQFDVEAVEALTAAVCESTVVPLRPHAVA
jgi:HD-GYP domain-containing protein (c-di-GMP phosphodiesterase class II)